MTVRAETQRGRCAAGLLAVLTLALAPAALAAGAQDDNYARDRRFATQPISGDAAAPDTTGFWFHVRRGEIARAREELERLQTQAPGWSPPEAMRRALTPAQNTPAAAPDAATLARQAQDARMERLAAVPTDAYDTIDGELLARARGEAMRFGRADHLLLLAWIALGRGDIDGAGELIDLAGAIDVSLMTTDARDAIARARARRAIARQDAPALAALLAGAQGEVARGALSEAAWTAFDNGDASGALWRFRQLPRSADARLGAALALRALGEQRAAIDAACTDILRAQNPSLCRDWLAERQAQRYAKADFAGTVAMGRELHDLGLATPGSRELVAWSLLELGERRAAAAEFEELLAASPAREDLAGALLRSTADDAQARETFARRFPAVRRARLRQQTVEAFARKQFDRVARLDAQLAELNDAPGATADADQDARHAGAATGRASLEISAGAHWRRRDGGGGLATVDRRQRGLDATALWGDWRWRLHANDSDYTMPAVAAGSWFGSAPVGAGFPGLREVSEPGLRLEASREFEGLNIYAGIARDLLDQPANETFTGQLSASFFGDGSTSAVTAYRRYRQDTLLSRVGNVDGRTGSAFGGALSTGLRGLHARRLGGDWSAAVSGHLETIDGEKIADNDGWQLRADLAKDHAGQRLDYWRTGPFVSYWHFDENLSDYSLGHGGYFSPDVFASAGLSTELLTVEGARWQIKAAANVAWSRIEQDAYRRFPLTGTGPPVPGRSDTGLSGEITLQAQVRLGPRWRLGGYLYHLEAIEFQATSAGLTLHFTPGGRGGVVSRDLPLETPWLKGFAL